jgi:hypothetical protein
MPKWWSLVKNLANFDYKWIMTYKASYAPLLTPKSQVDSKEYKTTKYLLTSIV